MTKPAAGKILIVDDEERNRRLLDVFVRADGYVTIAAADGQTGIALAISEQPDVILLDLMMPGMDGFEVTRALKANPGTCAIPIMIVTALEDVASHRRMLASGADEFINKPVDRWEMSMRIAKLLRQPDAPYGADPPDAEGVCPNG